MRRKHRETIIKQEEPAVLHMMIAMGNEVMRGIGLQERIDNSVTWDEKQCDVSPGNLASALILTMFYEKRPPLWRVDEWYKRMNEDTRALFGPEASCEKLNDDALGRMLDKIYEAGCGHLFVQICTQAIAKYDIAFSRIHSDTTTISFYGAYETGVLMNDSNGKVVKIVPGYNKDHRPGCAQVLVGKMVNEHGIPLCMGTMDGNTSDVEWNAKALDLLTELQSKGLQQGLYVADSKLMTHDLFERLTDPLRPIPFLSRVPANFNGKLERRMLESAYARDAWEPLGKVGNGKKASYYHGQMLEAEVQGKRVRVLVVRSSAGSERYEQKLIRRRNEMEASIAEVQDKRFACQADAQKEYERFLKANRDTPYITCARYHVSEAVKRSPGRPSLKQPKPVTVVETWSVEISITGLDDLRREKIKQQEEAFVLISSDLSLSATQLLRHYKEQQVVEIDFRYLKNTSIASHILLKTPKRVEALLMLMHVALLVNALLQYRLRKGRKAWMKPLPKIGWNGAEMMENPTVYYLECMTGAWFFKSDPRDPCTYDLCGGRSVRTLEILLEMMSMEIEDIMNALI